MTYSTLVEKYIPKTCMPMKSTNMILFQVTHDQLIPVCSDLYTNHKLQLKTIKATDERKTAGSFKIFYVFGVPGDKFFIVPYITVDNSELFPSLVSQIHEAALYEREIYTFFGIKPSGHPDLRPFILHENWPVNIRPLRKDISWKQRPADAHGTYEFQHVSGEGIYEIPVGPVHAGVIEPGHFRFSVAGEEIVALEPKLGYVHKGSEKLFETLPFAQKIKLAEHISGDTSFSHGLAFAQAIETLSNTTVPDRANYLRVVFSELERLASHINDVGFILNDTAFSFGGSNGPRLRERIMQINESLTGHRFLRGVITVGGVTKDISEEKAAMIIDELNQIKKDFEEIVAITEENESVMNRLQHTGILDKKIALDHGVVGIAARAVGIPVDARIDYPYAGYPELPVKIAKQNSGDVYARYWVRILEVYTAIDIILHALKKIPAGAIINKTSVGPLAKNAYTISITEGWRGDIVYFVATDAQGEISRVGIRDASFLNWPAVPYAVVENIVPDFPLINKSFNLSYSGFDR